MDQVDGQLRSSCTTENARDQNIKTQLVDLVTKAHEKYLITTKSMKENQDYLKKMYEDLSSSYDIISREMMEDVQTMEKALQPTLQIEGDLSKAFNFLERLKVSLNAPSNWLAELIAKSKRRQLTDVHKILKEHLTAKRAEIFNFRMIFLDYLQRSEPSVEISTVVDENNNIEASDVRLVSVTSITDPGKFYIVHWNDIEERDQLFVKLQDVAPNGSLPDIIVPDRIYAVFNSERKWFRATVALHFGISLVAEEPFEVLYQCFLVDVGVHERISEHNIRLLPNELMELIPFAQECTMNFNFEPQNWGTMSTALFKEWTGRGPMKMKVIDAQDGVLNVDLAQLPFEEERTILSVKDSLRPPSLPELPMKKFKPKYELSELNSKPLKDAVVIITKAAHPSFVYVQVDDEELARYRLMQQDIKEEFRTATNQSSSYSPSPTVGNAYAIQCGNEWHRVLIEKWKERVVVFYVDIGRRQVMQPSMMFHKLPERFMELPAQAVRCTLDGVGPPNKIGLRENSAGKVNAYPEVMFYSMEKYNGKVAVALFNHWNAGKVGQLAKSRELQSHVVLYMNGDDHSINAQLGPSSMARLNQITDLPDTHSAIRRNLFLQLVWTTRMADAHQSPVYPYSDPSLYLSKGCRATPLRLTAWKPAELPKVGDSFDARVTWFNKDGDIFLKDVESGESKVGSMRFYLKEKYNTTLPTERDLLGAPGDLCIARYGDDWFRCTITSVQGRSVGVFYEDFGNSGVVDVEDVRLDLSLEEEPVQVLRCKLFNLKPPMGAQEWTDEQRNIIFDEAYKWTFRVTVKVHGPQITLTYKSNADFNGDLVQLGYADYIDWHADE